MGADIDIRQSLGIGTSVMITGPPEGETINILYNRDCVELTLAARSITISGDSPINFYGNITFSSLSCTVPGKYIYFEAGKTYTILGDFKLEGGDGQFIRLLASQPGTQWMIDPQGGRDLNYVWVEDSVNIHPEEIYIKEGTKRGNCIGWVRLRIKKRKAEAFCRLAHKCLARSPRKRRVIIVVDRAWIHSPEGSRLVAELLKKQDMRLRLRYVPSYSPECTPMETFWNDWRDQVTHNHDRLKINDLEKDSDCYFARCARRPDKVLRRIGSPFAKSSQNRKN